MKKGQAALEYMMTYGWVILLFLIAIAALAYFGVLNPSRFLPNHCTLAPGFSCDDFKVTSSTIELVLRNGVGEILTTIEIDIPTCAQGTSDSWPAGGILISPASSSSSFILGDVVPCTNGNSGDRFKQPIEITYEKIGGVSHTVRGEIVAKVE